MLVARVVNNVESFIYVISSGAAVKIGYSEDPSRRLRQLQTGHERKVELAHQEPVPAEQASKLERLVHEANRHHRIQGEWFDLSIDDAKLEIEYALIRFGD
jgi:hypothetical protein